MKKLILASLLIFLSAHLLRAQTSLQGQVVDESGAGLPFVNITINGGKEGLSSDLDGFFNLSDAARIESLQFSYIGFETKVLRGADLKADPLKVTLKERITPLEEVTVLPGENPAHRMIRNAVDNKKLNDPAKLESFSYLSYSKFIITMNRDSIDPRIDTIMMSERLDSLQMAEYQEKSGQEDSILRVDSSAFQLNQFLSQRHIFFMETLTERKVKKPRDNETVLAQRTSGFKNPMFAMIVTQLQSFSFYDDFVGISGDEFLNPISKGSTKRYFFLIEDSIFTPRGDTLFTISFRPQPNKVFKALEGVITIDSRDWAIQNVRAVPAQEGGMQIEIRQEYQKYGPHTWFPISFEADIDIPFVSINSGKPQALMRRKLSRINLDPKLNSKDISRVELSIEEKDQEEVDSLLALYRTENLDSLEEETYTYIDSLSEAEDLERNLGILVTLSRGYIPWGPVNFAIDKVLNYNTYEGFRLGLDVETNDQVSDWLSVGAYGAYGFKDKEWKYGARFKLELHKNSRWEIFGNYSYDLYETSAFQVPYQAEAGLLQDNYRRLYLEQWDLSDILRSGMRIDPLPSLRLELALSEERRRTLGLYQFIPDGNQGQYRFTEAQASLRFAPSEEYAETPFGKIRIKESTPVFKAMFSQGLTGVGEGTYDYQRVIFEGDYKRMSRGYGQSHFNLRYGRTWGEVPATKLFTPQANFRNISDPWEANIGSLSDRNSFETMRFNEFLATELVTFMWRQDFRANLLRIGNWVPHLELVSRAAWGQFDQADLHQNIGLKSLEDGYFESGLEINKAYNWGFAGFGLGIYYRYGAEQLPDAIDNWAFKLTSKFSL